MIYSLVKVHKPQHNYWAISTIYNYLKDMEEEEFFCFICLLLAHWIYRNVQPEQRTL